jgi:hypothetical protein
MVSLKRKKKEICISKLHAGERESLFDIGELSGRWIWVTPWLFVFNDEGKLVSPALSVIIILVRQQPATKGLFAMHQSIWPLTPIAVVAVLARTSSLSRAKHILLHPQLPSP